MNERRVAGAVVVRMGIEADGKRICGQRETEEIIMKIKCGKAAGLDEILPEM